MPILPPAFAIDSLIAIRYCSGKQGRPIIRRRDVGRPGAGRREIDRAAAPNRRSAVTCSADVVGSFQAFCTKRSSARSNHQSSSRIEFVLGDIRSHRQPMTAFAICPRFEQCFPNSLLGPRLAASSQPDSDHQAPHKRYRARWRVKCEGRGCSMFRSLFRLRGSSDGLLFLM